MIKRPKRGESEDDLLKFQREFLARGEASSVNLSKTVTTEKTKSADGDAAVAAERDVVKLNEPSPSLPGGTGQPPPPKKSRFKAAMETKTKQKPVKTVPDTVSGLDPEELIDSQDTHMATVLTKIIERDTRNAMIQMPRQTGIPFPMSQPYDKQYQGQNLGKKKSLFARQFEQSPDDFGVTPDPSQPQHPSSMDVEEFPEDSAGSRIIAGTGLSATFAQTEAKRIHKENLSTITAMSEDQIREQQQNLLEMLDPTLIKFLKMKKTSAEAAKSDQIKSEPKPKKDKTVHKTSIPSPEADESARLIPMDKSWVHMDKVEYDKMEWMKDMPPPSTGDTRTGQQARFDFKGNLILNDTNIPVNVGLHHHGDEPERAGYTLEELFQLARSSNLQQRVLSLQTLARITQQAKGGRLEELIQTPILPSILDAGVVFLLRWALDDSVDSVVAAAVTALNQLLVNHGDQANLDRVSHWYQGQITPAHKPQSPDVSVGVKLPDVQEEKQEERDVDMSRRDLILALVSRMSLLPRLRYILDTGRPQPPTVIQILEILTRVVQHSAQTAYEVLNYKGLVNLIVKEFLPLSWKLTDASTLVTCVYGTPVPSAMRLLRAMCQAGRNMTAILLSQFQLKDRLLRYLVPLNDRSGQPSGQEVSSLYVESLRTWRTCLLYGQADSLYIDLYPVLVEQLKNSQSVLEQSAVDRTRLTAVIAVLEAVVCVSATKTSTASFKDSTAGDMETEEHVGPAVQWSHVADLIQPIKFLLTSVMADIGEQYQFKKYDLQVPVACLNFAATFYTKWQEISHDAGETVRVLEEIETIYNSCMMQWGTIGFQLIRQTLSQHSNLLYKDPAKKEVAQCLPELGCSSEKEEESVPVVRGNSPFGFLSSFLRLIFNLCKVHKGLLSERLVGQGVDISPVVILKDSDIRTYTRRVAASRPGPLSGNHFTKFENQFLYFYLKLATLPSYSEVLPTLDVKVLHVMALTLLTSLHHGDEHLAHDLLSTVVFNSAFWTLDADLTGSPDLSELQLSDDYPTHLQSATAVEVTFNQQQLCDLARSKLTSIRATYMTSLPHEKKQMMQSRQRHLMNPSATTSLLSSNIGECLFPLDWMFFPLIDLYNIFSTVGSDVQNALSASQVQSVSHVLSWIYLLECHRSRLVEPVSVTLKISRIMCTFLTGNDMFLDRTVNGYLAGLLRQYTRPILLGKLDFDESVPGLPSFYDLFTCLLQQFDAVSFGDPLFGCYILLPLQRRHSILFRKAIWTEYTGVLRTLSVPLNQLLVPIASYLEPDENDVLLIRLYYQSLLGVTLRPNWSPVLYLIVVHHVNRFMYAQDNKHTQLKAGMLKQASKSQNKELSQHLIYYKMANLNEKFGMSLYAELPPLRQKLLDSVMAS